MSWRDASKPTPFGVVFGLLVGCIPAGLAANALLLREVSYKVTMEYRFKSTPDFHPLGYWLLVGIMCSCAALIWMKTIGDFVFLVRSRRRK